MQSNSNITTTKGGGFKDYNKKIMKKDIVSKNNFMNSIKDFYIFIYSPFQLNNIELKMYFIIKAIYKP